MNTLFESIENHPEQWLRWICLVSLYLGFAYLVIGSICLNWNKREPEPAPAEPEEEDEYPELFV